MIELTGVTKRFGGHAALSDLSLRVEAGEVFCLLGPNGAGKTTTINLLLGFLQADSGRVVVAGHDVMLAAVAARQRTAYIPEQVALYPHLTGLENLRYFAAVAGAEVKSDESLLQALSEAGLSAAHAKQRVHSYSKGMRQKVGIAIALVRRASVLLLDEPTSGLDPSAARDFSDLVTRLASQGTSVLMTTHDLFRVREVATRVGIMQQGQLVRVLDRQALATTDLEHTYLNLIATA